MTFEILPKTPADKAELLARIHEILTLPPSALELLEQTLNKLQYKVLLSAVTLIDDTFEVLKQLHEQSPDDLPHQH